jgi:hypothetical protein
MTFELLRLIFRRYLALHSLWNDFWAENLRYAPLGTTFELHKSVKKIYPLGTTFELRKSVKKVYPLGTTFELSKSVKKIYFILIEAKFLQEIKSEFTLFVPY